MNCCVGIDLGSTTTKAVILDGGGVVVGRGITNSRSSYDVACQVALMEALVDTRFWLVASGLEQTGIDGRRKQRLLAELERSFRKQQYLGQLRTLGRVLRELLTRDGVAAAVRSAVHRILERMQEEAEGLFAEGASRKSDFFRDLAGSCYLQLATQEAGTGGRNFDVLIGLYDKVILEVENTPEADESFEEHAGAALVSMQQPVPELRDALERAVRAEIHQVSGVGTGYGRQRLPFPKEHIRSEILCHGLGAHAMFPQTRTVLDIGGQDTKAIQVDAQGIVTSFQMNDRCAAGCGRYLGYIADEMNMGLHEIGPLAAKSTRPVRINSTCTVFASAELREHLCCGQKIEDIFAGLHRAIILRAISLLARSGGIRNELTFTGGVARNPAAVEELRRLVTANYGATKLNVSPDSIYTGALGAALFALRTHRSANPGSPPFGMGPASQPR